MLKTYYRNLKGETLDEVTELRPGSWIRAEEPSADTIKQLSETYGLDEGHLRDALDPLEVPRYEVEGGTVYMYTRVPVREGEGFTTIPWLLVYHDEAVITLASHALPPVEAWVEKTTNAITTQKAKLLLQLLNIVNQTYAQHLNTIARAIRGLGPKLVERDVQNRDVLKLVAYEGVLQDFMSSLQPSQVVLNQLLNGKQIQFHEDDRDLIEDLVLSTGQMVELCRANLKTIVSLREASSTILTNNLNRVIRLLTSLTVILMIPNLITGLYGMNVTLPIADSPAAFTAILAVITALTALFFWIFQKNRWL
jgi:magnesium transporter